jgi:hypothetical protein
MPVPIAEPAGRVPTAAGNCHHDNLRTTGDAATPNPVHCEVFRHTMGLTLEMLVRLESRGRGERLPDVASMNDSAPTDAAWTPKAAPDLHRRPIVDELLVYSPGSHAVVNLNPTAARVLALCDGTRTVESLVATLANEFEAPKTSFVPMSSRSFRSCAARAS